MYLKSGSSCHGSVVNKSDRNHEVEGLIPGLAQRVKDPVWLWLWRRSATTAPIRPLCRGSGPRKGKKIKRQKKKCIWNLESRLWKAYIQVLYVTNPWCVVDVQFHSYPAASWHFLEHVILTEPFIVCPGTHCVQMWETLCMWNKRCYLVFQLS